MRIALDAMGGDHAPEAIVAGAALAVNKGFAKAGQIVLVGLADAVLAQAAKSGVGGAVCEAGKLPAEDSPQFPIVHASQVVGMDESPALAMRQKKDSSLLIAAKLVKAGRAASLISAGNTGACVAAAMFNLRGLEGVQRPGIAVNIEGEKGPFTVIDVGANVFPKPIHLLQYGIMGSCLQRLKFGNQSPRVGLVNIGGEEGKGNELAKETQELFRQSKLNFVGNVEGQDVFMGTADVIVTEGFVGNVILKLAEGLATHVLHVVRDELTAAGVKPEVLRAGLARITRRTDYSEYGGALLLGVEGNVVICHGRSDAIAMANAIRLSVQTAETALNDAIVAEIAAAVPAEDKG